MPEPYGVASAGSFGIGNTYIILTLGTTDWNTAAGTSGLTYKVGSVFTATDAGSGTGTARRLINDSFGRIGGKLLSDNLLRNGVDLYFKDLDGSDALLHLDVSGMRIGINTDPSAPIYTVDVNSDILSTNAEATSNLYVDNFTLSSIGVISVNDDIIVSPSGLTPQTLFNAWGSQSIVFDGNQLYSISNNDIVFTPDGIGTVELEASTNITGNLYVTGTINLDGDLSTIENITVGNDDTDDLLTFLAKFTSDLTSDSDISFDLGDGAFRWNDFYSDNIIAASNISTGNISLSSPATIESTSGDLIFSLSGGDKFTSFTNGLSTTNFLIQHNRIKSDINEDLQLEASGTGKVLLNNDIDFLDNLSIFGFIQMSGDLSTTRNIIIGDQPTDTLTINTDLRQDIFPNTTLTYDLGKSDSRWQNAYIDDWTNITNFNVDSILVDNQMLIGGTNNLLALTGNDDLILNPASGITIIEEIKFDEAIPFNTTPIVIDNPNAQNTSAGDEFGGYLETNRQVAASSSQFVVGAWKEYSSTGSNNFGYVYVFDITDGSLQFSIANPNPDTALFSDFFGYAVDISDSFIIVGAPNANSGFSQVGQAYVFDASTGNLLLTLDNPNVETTPSSDFFGDAVAVTESYAVVAASAENADPSNDASGVVYVFDVTDGSLLYTLINPNYEDVANNDRFGVNLAASESYLIIAAPEDTVDAYAAAGVVYIYDITDGTLLYTIPNPESGGPIAVGGARFGSSVDITENYAIIGSLYPTAFGTAYIYDLSDGSLLHTINNPNAFSTPNNDRFGLSVSMTDSLAIVGSPQEDDVGGSSSGKAYVFNVADGSLLYTLDNPNAYSTSAGDGFGRGVIISTTGAVVTAPFEDDAGGTSSGKAYLYTISTPGSRITNLNTSTPVTLSSTGIGYYKFEGSNALVIPAGDTASRPSSPEIGDTRWNTDEQYLECFDGSVYVVSIGPGSENIDQTDIEDLNTIYNLMLG